MNAVQAQPKLMRWPATGPVYVIVNDPEHMRCTTDSGGTHPLFSSYESRASQIAEPWQFEKCNHMGVDRFLGGIHFLDLTFTTRGRQLKPRVDIAVIWGMHGEHDVVDEQLYKNPSATPWKTWCRVFHMSSFMEYARTSTDDLRAHQLFRGSGALTPREIQNRLKDQRWRLCLKGFESLSIEQEDGPKRLYPGSCHDRWTQDVLPDVIESDRHIVDVFTSVDRIEGLGRTLYELKLGIEVTEKESDSERERVRVKKERASRERNYDKEYEDAVLTLRKRQSMNSLNKRQSMNGLNKRAWP